MAEVQQSRVALVVVKLKVRSRPYFLMRKNRAWGDITFIGGHINDRDGGLLQRAAYRELLEEVPPLRQARDLELTPLTPQLNHGPIESLSALATVMYDLQFFQLLFRHNPEKLLASLGPRSLNVWVAESELLHPRHHKVATLVEILNREYQGGLSAIPFSWPGDLESIESRVSQPALAFQ